MILLLTKPEIRLTSLQFYLKTFSLAELCVWQFSRWLVLLVSFSPSSSGRLLVLACVYAVDHSTTTDIDLLCSSAFECWTPQEYSHPRSLASLKRRERASLAPIGVGKLPSSPSGDAVAATKKKKKCFLFSWTETRRTHESNDRFSSWPAVWLRLSSIVSRGAVCAWRACVYFVYSWPSRKKCRWGKERDSWFFDFSYEDWELEVPGKKEEKDSCSLVSLTLNSDFETIFLKKTDLCVSFCFKNVVLYTI